MNIPKSTVFVQKNRYSTDIPLVYCDTMLLSYLVCYERMDLSVRGADIFYLSAWSEE